MKTYIFILLTILSLSAFGQDTVAYYQSGSGYTADHSMPDWYRNLQKYWFYRYRLVNDFTYIGPNPGESLIAQRRTKRDAFAVSGTNYNSLDFEDQTIDLGHYLGVLATEYELLKNNGFNTDRTLYEIKWAQNAYDRLRLHSFNYYANTHYGGISTYPPALAPPSEAPITGDVTCGFFLRDDVPFLTFLDPSSDPINAIHYQHFNRAAIRDSFYSTAAECNSPDPGAGFTKEVNKCWGSFKGQYWNPANIPAGCDLVHTGSGDNVPNCESQDQLADIFLGESFLLKYLDQADPVSGPLYTRAENALWHTMDWLSHPCGPYGVGIIPFYSIPKIGDPSWCAKSNCSSSGIFLGEACPAMAATNLLCPAYAGPSASLMAITDNPVWPILWGSYWFLFQGQQIVTPNCTSHLHDIEFTDTYAAVAGDYAAFEHNFLSFFWVPYSPVWWLNYASFLTNLGAMPTTWSTIKWHAENDYQGAPHLPLVFELNFGPHVWPGHNYIEHNLLNSAPPCGIYDYEYSKANEPFHPTGYGGSVGEDYFNASNHAYANPEWSGNDRLSEPYHRQGLAFCYYHDNPGGYDMDFNGLDYMYLFNLYSLVQGSSYMGGMMNSYYFEKFNVDYPASGGIGSSSNKLKLSWLEYVSAINKVHASGNGWLDFRGAKVIDLKPGFHAEKGSFFYAHIQDYDCSGGDQGHGPYNFAELNPTILRPVPGSESKIDTGWRQIAYLPNGTSFINERLPVPDPRETYADSIMSRPGFRDTLAMFYKYIVYNEVKDTEMLKNVQHTFGWEDDNISDYIIHVPGKDNLIEVTALPNPTNGICYLAFTLAQQASLSISLTNSLGQNFNSFIDPYETNAVAGDYKIALNTDKVAPGIYYATINIGSFTVTKKIVVF